MPKPACAAAPNGRLIEFHAIPSQIDPDGAVAPAPDWAPLFSAAGLTMSTFHAVEPRWLPRSQSDSRVAWEGPLPGFDGSTVRVEAASYRGQTIFFNVIAPWTRQTREVPAPLSAITAAVNPDDGTDEVRPKRGLPIPNESERVELPDEP